MGVVQLIILSAVAAATVAASGLSVISPKVTITGSDAAQLLSESLQLTPSVLPELSLGPSDTIKLTFQVVEDGEGKGVQPHQTFLRFYDESSGEEGVQPVRVTPGGKAKFELNMARPPASLPPTSNTPLKVELLLGSFEHSPAKYVLFELTVPPSQPAPVHPDEASFHLLPPIEHTFRPANKAPPLLVSALFAYMTVSPWLLLVALWLTLSPKLPHLASPYVLPFLGCLGAFEGLLFYYWVGLRLGQVLLYGAGLGTVTILAGQQALSKSASWRTGSK